LGGYGLGGFGRYGMGYGGYGMGYGGYGYPYGGYGYGSYGYPSYGYSTSTPMVVASNAPVATSTQTSTTPGQFAAQGEAAFKARDYKSAEYYLRHAVTDDPQNGVLLLMMAQAMYANGQYDEAAGATQQAMAMLPQDQWGVVVSNFRELYTNVQDDTDQLRALEKAAAAKPTDPATHFLLGFHYGYLGYPRDAVAQLDQAIKAAPQDQAAKKLRDIMAAKLPQTP
jgi:tetratricopeptide (TPR) repeat protein